MKRILFLLLACVGMTGGHNTQAQPADSLWVPQGTRWVFGCLDLIQKEYSTGIRQLFLPTEADWKALEAQGACAYVDSTAYREGRWMQRIVASHEFARQNPEARALWVSWDGTRLLAHHRDTAIVLVDFSWKAGQTVRYPTWSSPPALFSDDAGWRRWVQTNFVQEILVDSVFSHHVLGRERRCVRWDVPQSQQPDSWGPDVIEGLGGMYHLWPNANYSIVRDAPPVAFPLVYFHEGVKFWPPDSLALLPDLFTDSGTAPAINAHAFCIHPKWVSRPGSSPAALDLNVHPNPATDRVAVEFMGWGLLEAYDAQGRQVLRREGSGPLDLDVSGWARGLYTLRLRTAKTQYAGRLVKN